MNFAPLEEQIGYRFKNKEILQTAFTHSTYANAKKVESNEKMECLGDAVLEFCVTKDLYFAIDLDDEHEITEERKKLVSDSNLLAESERLNLKKYLLFIGGEQNLGKKTVASLYECLLAAVYLDGGIEEAEQFLKRNLTGRVFVNYKGDLQEYLQKKKKPLPVYKALEKRGKDNAPEYRVSVYADGKEQTGVGKSLPQAEQKAAENWLKEYKRK